MNTMTGILDILLAIAPFINTAMFALIMFVILGNRRWNARQKVEYEAKYEALSAEYQAAIAAGPQTAPEASEPTAPTEVAPSLREPTASEGAPGETEEPTP
jgi:hypothetical protein